MTDPTPVSDALPGGVVEGAFVTESRRRKLKVYGGCFDGQTRFIVAARTQMQAAKVFETTAYQMRERACETGNEHELRVALAEPGIVFSAPENTGKFVRGLVEYRRGRPWPPEPHPLANRDETTPDPRANRQG